ncbi:MAG: DNA ligase [Firmicutes bacterium]|nr:DNA ligase [Bacillota bacterium]
MIPRDPAAFLPPMLAVTADTPFDDPGWWYEIKWDGFRALIHRGEDLKVYSRRGANLLARWPVLADLAGQLPVPLVLDAELVAMGPQGSGRPGYRPGALVAVVFDCLYGPEGWLLDQPFERRRECLLRWIPGGGRVVLSEGVTGSGLALLEAARRRGLEGVMAKRLGSPYLPGRRSRLWQKFLVQEEVTLPWQGLVSRRDGRPLWVLGRPEAARVPAPAAWLRQHPRPPVAWVRVRYRERTPAGRLRHPQVVSWGSSG